MASQVISRRHRVSYNQLESLWEFLNSHRDIAVGFNKTAQAREQSRRMWTTVAKCLNSMEGGATKDWKGWSQYWIDFKAKLKKKAARIRAAQNRKGGGPSEETLTDVDKKMLSLLGEDYGGRLPNTQVDPVPDLTESVHDVPAPAPERSSRRRRIRQHAMSQQMARETLVDISRNRLLAEQSKAEHLGTIAQSLNRNVEVQQQILDKLNEIASVLTRSICPRRPQSRDEGVP